MSSDDIYIVSSSSTASISTSSNGNFSSPLSSSSSSISMSSNGNFSSPSSSSSSSISMSSNGNFSSPSPSSNPIQYSSDRILYLLKKEKQQYDVIDNKSSSAVASYWTTFGFPAKFNEKTGIFERIMGFTSCRKCKKTFAYGPNSGTSHMKQHSCATRDTTTSTPTQSPTTQTKIEKMMVIRKTLSNEQSNTVKDLIVRWICGNIRPISIIEDDGLRILIQECVKLGSIYGNIDVNDLLRGRTTVSNHIKTVAKSSRERIKELLQEPYKNGCLSISPDLWSDKYNQISYLGVTAVITDQDYKYYTIDLFCKPFQEYEKTAENILIALQNEMKVFGIDDLSKVTIVCDRGSNFLKAFRDLNPITCYGHRLNNVLKRSFFQHQKQKPTSTLASVNETSSSDEDDEFHVPSKPLKVLNMNSNVRAKVVKGEVMTAKLVDAPPAAQQLIKTITECKSLIKYIKKAGLNKEIQEAGGFAIRQAIVVRWLSLIDSLESINSSFLQLKVVLNRRKQQQRLFGINQYLVKQIIRLLKPFKAVIKMVQSGSNPTLYLVLPSTLSLRKILNSWDSLLQHIEKSEDEVTDINYDDQQEDEGVSYVRERILALLNSMIQLDIRHYCATILHPDYRSLKGCSNDERIACHNYIREQMKLFSIERNDNTEQTQEKKRFKSDHSSILDDFKDHAITGDDEYNDDDEFDENYDARSIEYSLPMIQSDELSRYLSMKIDMKDYSSNVLTFWKSNVHELPRLSKLARQIHSIPATSAGIERQFSIAGLTLTDRRTSLEPEQLDNILCIRAMVKFESQM